MTALRLAFMGTPDFSVPALESLITAGHDIACVYTQPPRPAGRGKKLRKSPVQEFAESKNIEVRHPENFKQPSDVGSFRALNLDAAVVVAYGLILPKELLDAPKLGCLNIHASLLPRWRGAAPIQRAILAGDAETGVSIMQMDQGLDTGDILTTGKLPITAGTNAQVLHDQLSDLGGEMIVDALDGLNAGTITPTPQPVEGVTYAEKLRKEEGQLVWMAPAEDLERQIRAFTPWPGAFFHCGDERIKVLEAEHVKHTSTAGFVIDDGITVGCGIDALKLKKLQRPGKKPLSAKQFLQGHTLCPGKHLTCYK